MENHLIIASHGSLAEGMLSAIKMIAGEQEYVSAYGLDKYQTPNNIYNAVKQEIDKNPKDHFIICCDIPCGSVHNALVVLCENDNVQLVSGINLGLILSLVLANPEDLTRETMLNMIEEARKNLMYFDKEAILASNLKEDDLW